MQYFPAVFVGGPPHSGKSVLIYSLSQALRTRGIQHYVMRTCPDGEGDFSNEATPEIVRAIRVKGRFTPEFIAHMRRDVQNRHLPLLVDVGGKPQGDDQMDLLGECTHAILLSHDPGLMDAWREYAGRCSIPILAEIESRLIPPADPLTQMEDQPNQPLRGVISGLERRRQASGPVFERLVRRLAGIFEFSDDEIQGAHLSAAPVETVIVLDRLLRTLNGLPPAGPIASPGLRWQPADLLAALDYVPAATPLGLYGRAPNWVYAALWLHQGPAVGALYDVRCGWLTPPVLSIGPTRPDAPVQFQVVAQDSQQRLEVTLPFDYLDVLEAPAVGVPDLSGQGIVLSGKIPHWYLVALARCYVDRVPWLAVYNPGFGDRAMIVNTTDKAFRIGDLVSSPPVTR